MGQSETAAHSENIDAPGLGDEADGLTQILRLLCGKREADVLDVQTESVLEQISFRTAGRDPTRLRKRVLQKGGRITPQALSMPGGSGSRKGWTCGTAPESS